MRSEIIIFPEYYT